MSRSSSTGASGAGSASSERYHHGDLRPALVRAAIKLLRQDGIERLSLRAVAREAGVSHMAPYHHFADKRGLIGAVAAAGFRELRRAMVERMATEGKNPARSLQESAVAAILFATHNPDHYRMMFGPVLAHRSAYPELEEAARAAFEAILGGLRGADVTADGEEATRRIGIAAWAMVHGLAMLLIDGQLEAEEDNEVERVARQATDLLWLGLASLVPRNG